MELEDLKERYKLLPIVARLGMAFIIGAMPIAYIYLENGTQLSDQLTQLQQQEEASRQKFEKARQRKASLPNLEQQLAFTEEQLVKARKLLPESFRIEDILQKVALIAREVGVSLVTFTPKEEVKADNGYPSVEIPIGTEIVGRFGEIAGFIDRIVRLETTVFVRSIAMTTMTSELAPLPLTLDPQQNFFLKAKEAREKTKERAVLTISAYRSQTDAEIAAYAPRPIPTPMSKQSDGKASPPDSGDIQSRGRQGSS